ncbi:fluoride efflux transporter FluC [Umezawaea beigongshangensis]|uniref:fluoride efflux transporter FluC n=1 Tax=Umezawaea beigongshangensis TaxID=2780383 RepID=UPI0027DB6669|nr:CrcB family protein [Umezawaea beigongshangensis]
MSGQPVLAAVALGGGIGGVARYALTSGTPLLSTFAVNVLGCALIGVLVVLADDAHPLVRPFLGVGVLGGFTTFSAYAADVLSPLEHPVIAVPRLVLTPVACLAATAVAAALTRGAVRR